MPRFQGHAKSLSQLYTFYDRLGRNDGYPTLSRYVRNAATRITTQTKNYSEDTSSLRAQAQAEFAKEKRLLQEKFGVNIPFDYYSSGDGGAGFKEVIDALNAAINLKDVYERNRQVLTRTNGMKGVFSFYPTYFMKAWEEKWPNIRNAFYNQYKNGGDPAVILSSIIDCYINGICERGLILMLDGPEVEAKTKMDPELKGAYAELTQYIGSVQNAGSVAQQIFSAYQLDKLKTALTEGMVVDQNTKKIYAKDFKGKVKNLVSKDLHKNSGLALEALVDLVYQSVGAAVGGQSFHTGSFGVKADNILTLGIDSTIVKEHLNEAIGDRDANIKAFSALGDKLKNLDDGFIVYTNAKNYSFNKNYSGIDVGSTGKNAQDFLMNLPHADSGMKTLLGSIQQLGAGAILEGQQAVYEKLLAQEVAYMLFDDYTTIGEVSTSGNAIHVMNINGVMFPMSVILSMLADAIEEVTKTDPRRIVSVTIKAPPILYPDPGIGNGEDYGGLTPAEAWNAQRQYALNNTKITATLLRDIRSLIGILQI